MKTNSVVGSVLAVVLGVAANSRSQTILTNGSFESFGGTGYNSNTGAGLTGWSITGSGIDIVPATGVPPSYWLAADGSTSLSLNWSGAGAVSQVVATTPGMPYLLSFSMAAEIFGGPATRTMDVYWGDTRIGQPSFAYTGQGPTDMGWVLLQYSVVGTGTDVLGFVSTTAGSYGPALDAVSLVAVPEPRVGILCGLGTAMVLWSRRIRRRDRR